MNADSGRAADRFGDSARVERAMRKANKRWVVAHASGGAYTPSCFHLDEATEAKVEAGGLLVETKLLSLDPTHLNWVKLDPTLQFLPITVGDVMIGTNIGVVLESQHPDYAPGQAVMGTWGWEQIARVNPALVRPALPYSEMAWSDQLTILSHIGQAAAGGLLLVGRLQETDAVLVSAAAGATGSIAAQIAKARGCRTIGIAGGVAKCRYLTETLGLDGAIDYRGDDLESAIAAHFPDGIDLFFDNVGGEILDAALSNMAVGCRIVTCGAIAQYDQAGAEAFAGIKNLPMLIFRRASMTGFVAGGFGDRNALIHDALLDLFKSGQIKVPVHMTTFDEIPQALSLLLSGGNRGKLIARIA